MQQKAVSGKRCDKQLRDAQAAGTAERFRRLHCSYTAKFVAPSK